MTRVPTERRRTLSLRASLTLAVIVLAILAVGGAVSLVLSTTYLHRAAMSIETSAESIRVSEELLLDLFAHDRAPDAVIRASLAGTIRGRLGEARHYVSTAREAAVFRRTERDVMGYLEAAPNGGARPVAGAQLARASAGLEELVRLNVAQARASRRAAAGWDHFANILGTAVAIILVGGVIVIAWWLRSSAFEPVFKVSDALRLFASGDRSARVPEKGPSELRSMARLFNEMAGAIERQRQRQLEFLAAVAHDLRNPLSALGVSTAVLADPATPLPSEARLRQTAGLIQRQVRRLDRMVGDLLDAASIEAGRLDLRLGDHDARFIVRAVFDLFESASPLHQLDLEIPDAAVPLRCDGARIEQALTNLVSNAIKYSPTGGKVTIDLAEEGEDAVFSVADRGIGIPPEELPHIFEPFRRAAAAREAIAGVGLGLSVARQIVEAHGGRIEVESQVGKGSTFRIRLPLARAAERPVPHAEARTPAP
ncbi:MAG: HAMP domain-containing protein [Deltaproteobacteria bacterium]|nr:HAMP domain-containing protein [Deltaproteobacteria bacterium]